MKEGDWMNGLKKRIEKEKERILKEKGWFVPSIHNKYIRRVGGINES